MNKQSSFWESERLTMERSIALTVESLQAYGTAYRHWAIAYSGGKDSTATVSLITSLIESGSKDGSECGQGWFQVSTPDSVADVLAPLLHWRVCHVWDWLQFHAPKLGFSTQMVAEAYGGEEAEEINARTGCVGCNLASKDVALDTILKLPQWSYLAPMKRLNQINEDAQWLERPMIDLINTEEHRRILALMEANTWPDRWTGEEMRADALVAQVFPNGAVQPLLKGVSA